MAASVGNRAPPQGEGASGGVLSSASDDGGGFKARCASSSNLHRRLNAVFARDLAQLTWVTRSPARTATVFH